MASFIANILQDDIGEAIVDTIIANPTHFSSIDLSDTVMRVEYGRIHKEYSSSGGRCLVIPLVPNPIEKATGSAFTDFGFQIQFETKDTQGNDNDLTRIGQAIRSVFGDQGEQLFANFTDSATPNNRLGAGEELNLGDSVEEVDPDGKDFVKIITNIGIQMWHRVPMKAPA